MNKSVLLAAVLSAAMLLANCSDNKTGENSVSSSTVSPFSEAIVLSEKPTGAISVEAASGKIEKGKQITVAGIIGCGTSFDTELAIFTLTQKTAFEQGCAAACKQTAPAALVQYKGKDGKVVKSTLEGFKGLRKGVKIIVVGTVDEVSTSKSPVINLKGFYILP